MGWLFLWLGLAFGTQIWLCFRVGRSNIALAIATFFIGFPAALYTVFKHHGDEETTVTVPLLANLVFSALFFVSAWQTLLPLLEAQSLEFDEKVVAVASVTPLAERASVPAAPPALAEQAASAAETLPAPDAMDAFSAALRASGLAHTMTRLPAATQLPPGVTDAALFSVQPMANSAASAPAVAELSATLFKCDSVTACRNLAGAHMQQGEAAKKRVLQNGLLLLSMPAVTDSADLTPTAVAGAFRKL